MNKEMFEELTNSIQEKLGQENVSLIADDLGKLITDNAQMNEQLKSKDDTISKLKQDKEALITANGNLLQQVAMGDESEIVKSKEKEEETKPKHVDFRAMFDAKGNFKH